MKVKEKKIKINEKEKKIIYLISYGFTNEEIATDLKVTNSSLQNTILNLLRKTNTFNRANLVRWGFENKYLK